MSIIGQTTAVAPIRDGHQGGVDSGNVNPLLIDQYNGSVEHQFLKESMMRGYIKFHTVKGTDTVTNRRIGTVSLQKVTRGVRPSDNSPTFDNISVKVDTIVLARSTQALLDDFLEHIDARRETGKEHGMEIGKFFDESFLVQTVKACQITNTDPDGLALGGWEQYISMDGTAPANGVPANIVKTAPKNFKGGTVVTLAEDGDELDPDILVDAILRLCQGVEEKDVEISEATLFVRPAQYYTLVRNDKLINKDFSTANGDYAQGTVLRANGIRIQTTNRLPSQADVGQTHFLSNAGNDNAYNVTQADANCVVLLMMPKALLAGETIPLTSQVYYVKQELQWYIDSYLSFGVTPNRSEHAGGIFLAEPTDAPA